MRCMFASISDTLLIDGLKVMFSYWNMSFARLSIFSFSSAVNCSCLLTKSSLKDTDSVSSRDTGLISGVNVSCCICFAS